MVRNRVHRDRRLEPGRGTVSMSASSPAPCPLIEADGVSRRHGMRIALADFSLSVRAGEAVALVGANGAGKTTALRLLALRARPDSGRVRIAGRDGGRAGASLRRRIGLLAQVPSIAGEFSVREGVSWSARLHGLRGAELRRAVDEALTLMDLETVSHRRAGNLSQGVRQRMALAQSLAHAPEVLLLDEPTAGLDPGQAAALRARLAGLRDGRALVIATHLAEDLRPLCQRALVLRAGRPAGTVDLERRADDLLIRLTPTPQPEDIESLPGVATVTAVEGGYLRITLSQPGARGTLVTAIASRGWDLLEWRPAAEALDVLLRDPGDGSPAC